MVKFEVCNWAFEEDIYFTDKLCFRTNGLGKVFVEFDLMNNPHLKTEDGDVFFRLSPDIEACVIEEIKTIYPRGFHKRVEENLSWIRDKIQALQGRKHFELLNLIPHGGIRIDDCYYDSYYGELEVDGTVQSVIIAASSFHDKLFMYRQFLSFPSPDKNPAKYLGFRDNEKMQIMAESNNGCRIFTNQYVACSCYEYSFGGILRRETIGLRNDFIGGNFRSYLGNFFLTKLGVVSIAS